MRQSQLFTKTLREVPADEPSKNAQFLTRGGFVYKNSAGVYSYLPLGWRVINRLSAIIREEMNAIGGIEIFMPALVDRKYLEATGRFKLDVGFDVLGKKDKRASYSLGWTHEEVLTAIASRYINSHKDLPKYIYQIQTKFRNEARAKSGLLRGREFLMKDLYSFHESEKDLFDYYDEVKEAYFNIFKRCGLSAFYTIAGGGDFTISNTHEFQVLADVGEDTILFCQKCRYAENSEISKLKKSNKCPECGDKISQGNAIEVGNIFPLGAKYSEAFGLEFQDDAGKKKTVIMGSYGIGISRLMGTIAELHNDERGIVWPAEVAPFAAHLIRLQSGDLEVGSESDKVYNLLQNTGIEVLYDDREGVSSGEKFADADLLGMPVRLVVSEKTLAQNAIEVKERKSRDTKFLNISNVIETLRPFFQRHRD